MGGGGKTSTSSTTNSSPYSGLLANFGRAGLPVFQQFASQVAEAGRSGGVNAGIPLINRSLDASRQAASTASTGTAESLAKAGLGNSSFGQRILSDEQAQQGENIAQIPTSIAGQIAGMAPTVSGIGLSGAQAAAQSSNTSNTASTPSAWDTFTQGAGLALTGKAGSGVQSQGGSSSSGGGWNPFSSGGSSGGSGKSSGSGAGSLFSTALMS